MSILFPSPVFGPIRSRRLGISLGINLMPADGKVCTFNCIYCECGLNEQQRPHTKRPTREDVRRGLEAQLIKMKAEGETPDVLTFAGNGEPTSHPDFTLIIDDTIELRNTYFPQARISVLSNATLLHKPDVFNALKRVDNNIQKLDTVSADYIKFVDQPTGAYHVEQVIQQLCDFEGQVIVQTLFMKGEYNGRSVDNLGEEYVLPWLEAIKRINPKQVMIYTIDRATPVDGLLKAKPEELDHIVARVRALGIEASASY